LWSFAYCLWLIKKYSLYPLLLFSIQPKLTVHVILLGCPTVLPCSWWYFSYCLWLILILYLSHICYNTSSLPPLLPYNTVFIHHLCYKNNCLSLLLKAYFQDSPTVSAINLSSFKVRHFAIRSYT